MATTLTDAPAPIELPKLPAPVKDFIPYFSSRSKTSLTELLEPYKNYESGLRKVYAQQPTREAVSDGLTNTVPIFAGHEADLKIRARCLDEESAEEKEKYIMPLDKSERRMDGAPAVVTSLKEFQYNFNLFSESSLTDLDWRNVVAAGSAVTTALLPVPEKWAGNKRSLREYYHEHLAPASDVDLFIYGLNEEQALEKIKQIERSIKDSILHETTTIRTKNAITIASQYPTRHVQIVLRLYDSISQIITGFDVDCACAAYNGSQVYASPRALAAFATQINTIDLTRRSPSYENRLSKYSHRGFEVHWPLLDRSRIDPTIFERSFMRTNGLARLLVLEKLPKTTDRDAYMDQRRTERGRPPANRRYRNQHRLYGNVKEDEEDDVAEWVEEDQISNYHTMVVPYGKRFNAAKINRLLYSKDLLLNAEWSKPKDREVNLHRHPCFFGNVEEVLGDCCGFCPAPKTEEEIEVAEGEGKLYVSGNLTFIKDDPGRQEIGSFHPITTDDWCEMAFVGNTQMLCQAIVDGDLEYVQAWCTQEGNDLNTRDYCGRTPLHLAVIAAASVDPLPADDESRKRSLEVVQCLIDNGARLVARLVDGRTALHLAAAQGNIEIVDALMKRSLANEEEEDEKLEKRKSVKRAGRAMNQKPEDKDDGVVAADTDETESEDLNDTRESDEDDMTMGSFVKVDSGKSDKPENSNEIPEDTDEPDFYDINVLAWDFQTSPLHLAIINGHIDMIRLLVYEYGADVLLPIKLGGDIHYVNGNSAILSLVLLLSLPIQKAKEVAKVLLELGATCAQGDMNQFTAFHYIVAGNHSEILDILLEHDAPAAQGVLNFVTSLGDTALTTALKRSLETMVTKLRSLGAKATIPSEDYIKAYISKNQYAKNWNPQQSLDNFRTSCNQPLTIAAIHEMPKVMEDLLAGGADPSTLDTAAYRVIKDTYTSRWQKGLSVLDFVLEKLKVLREYKEEEFDEKEPEKLNDESFYTSGYKEGSYQHWLASRWFQEEQKRNQELHEKYEKRLSEFNRQKMGIQEKADAVQKLIQGFEDVEKTLMAAGAKTFKEMYPDIPEPDYHNYSYNYKAPGLLPFEVSFSFDIPYLDDRLKEGYLRLFEAAWRNDIEEVKSLTLCVWTFAYVFHRDPPENESPFKTDTAVNQPLQIAARDVHGFTAFSIAVLRGHYQLARAIAEIALAQYEPEDKTGIRERWTINGYDSEDESDSGNYGPTIFSEIVSDTFTIENVAAISSSVKSRVKPLTMIRGLSSIRLFMENGIDPVVGPGYLSLMEYAIRVDDMKLLKFILQISLEYLKQQDHEDETSVSTVVDQSLFNIALQLGRTAMLAEMIKVAGVGIPFTDLVKKSGIELKEKPRYYQGLSIGGKKNKDWAQAGRNRYDNFSNDSTDQSTPLLRAAYYGNIESLQWFLSDAPLRRYMEFAAANKEDKRVLALELSKVGFEKTIGSWLSSRSTLALHCAILWNPAPEMTKEYVSLVKFVLRAIPESLEQKSCQGFTPLHVAVAIRRPEIIELLIDAGANQRVRDACGRNVVHNMVVALSSSILRMDGMTDLKRLRDLLQLFDKDHVKEMLLERCTVGREVSTLTPLAYWMIHRHGWQDAMKPELIKILMEYSQGEDLELINGEGDLPLHYAVKQSLPSITSYLISVRPELLHRENATGRTPLEMASDLYMQERVTHAPNLQQNFSGDFNNHIKTGLVDRPASEFVVDEEKEVVEVASKKRVYEICMEAAQQVPSKRRLVSLFEANEVARRLAGVKKRLHGASADSDADQKFDEVSTWLR